MAITTFCCIHPIESQSWQSRRWTRSSCPRPHAAEEVKRPKTDFFEPRTGSFAAQSEAFRYGCVTKSCLKVFVRRNNINNCLIVSYKIYNFCGFLKSRKTPWHDFVTSKYRSEWNMPKGNSAGHRQTLKQTNSTYIHATSPRLTAINAS